MTLFSRLYNGQNPICHFEIAPQPSSSPPSFRPLSIPITMKGRGIPTVLTTYGLEGGWRRGTRVRAEAGVRSCDA
ncbi:hypothetical protein ES332_D04G018000v1 [Gossypium tomentosum]|uniref:Uncharacterized protein n=1 Tax=Gossypium tomentosum TaxID=34277 RepID=A0A5D2L854_GOSTO|nr:hypothetical protein ES332_D04G018000v1 [Gossypium tomentosum]